MNRKSKHKRSNTNSSLYKIFINDIVRGVFDDLIELWRGSMEMHRIDISTRFIALSLPFLSAIWFGFWAIAILGAHLVLPRWFELALLLIGVSPIFSSIGLASIIRVTGYLAPKGEETLSVHKYLHVWIRFLLICWLLATVILLMLLY